MITREDYMTGKSTHAEYYGQFVTANVQSFVVRSIGEKYLRASKDQHMNDIPLRWWDGLHPAIMSMCAHNVSQAHAPGVYSLSDSVCIAKAAARAWLAAHPSRK